MSKVLKEVITQEEFDELRDQERQVVEKYYEFVTQDKPFKITYVKKDSYYGNPEDIVTDKTCDLSFLKNATIKKVGFHKKAREGGLAIVYEKDGQEKVAVMGFTELGMWIYANVETKQ